MVLIGENDGEALDRNTQIETLCCRPWEGPEYEGLLVEGEEAGGLSWRGFLAKWAFTTAVNPRATLEHALLLGYRGDPSALFYTSRPRRVERKSDAPGRTVYQVSQMDDRQPFSLLLLVPFFVLTGSSRLLQISCPF